MADGIDFVKLTFKLIEHHSKHVKKIKKFCKYDLFIDISCHIGFHFV